MNDRKDPSRDPADGQRPGDPKPPEPPLRLTQRSWVWVLLMLATLFFAYHLLAEQFHPSVEVSWNDFTAQIEKGNVASIEQKDALVIEAKLKTPQEVLPVRVKKPKTTDVIVANMNDGLQASFEAFLKEHNVPRTYMDTGNQVFLFILAQIIPILLLVGIFWYVTSRVRRQMGPGLFGRFTGNRARRFEKGKDDTSFQDVAGLRNVKMELQEIVDFLKNPDRFTRIGAKIPKGVLLVGPPGTGKTLLARAVAGEAGVPFFSISGSEFIELFVGVGASRVRELFDEAKKSAPCIVFIDEIDAVGRSRGTGLGGGHDEREQTLNQILSEMDGFEANQAVIVLAATNRPDVLDPALVRPGRFDRQVIVERPQREGRVAILKVHTRRMPLADDVDLEKLARGTIGFSGADLQNLANESALMAARDGQNVVRMKDFERAKDKIMLGTLRDEAMSVRERKVTAYHEAGHALLTLLLPGTDPVHSVTIVPRGRSMGVMQVLPEEDAYTYTREFLKNKVIVFLGGRAAEKLIFDESTTGAEDDLEKATGLVERMVCRWGMSEKLGPVSFRRGAEHVFLGRELGEQKAFSEHTAMLIDEEVRHFLDDAYRAALDLLTRERKRLVTLAEQLLEREILNDVEIYELLDLPKPARLAEQEVVRPATTPGKKKPAEDAKKPAEGIDPGLLGLEGA